MKDSAEHSARLKRFINRIRRELGAPTVGEPTDPTTELMLACLSVDATEAKARAALNRLHSSFVDFNELRVSRPEEIVDVMGKGFPAARETAASILALLKEVFDINDSLDLSQLVLEGKREARSFIEQMEHATPYVVARIMLNSLEAHAFPVNDQMIKMLRSEEIITAQADAADVQGFLERHISATTIRKTYMLLRKYADGYRPKRKTTKKASKKKTKKTKTIGK